MFLDLFNKDRLDKKYINATIWIDNKHSEFQPTMIDGKKFKAIEIGWDCHKQHIFYIKGYLDR